MESENALVVLWFATVLIMTQALSMMSAEPAVMSTGQNMAELVIYFMAMRYVTN